MSHLARGPASAGIDRKASAAGGRRVIVSRAVPLAEAAA